MTMLMVIRTITWSFIVGGPSLSATTMFYAAVCAVRCCYPLLLTSERCAARHGGCYGRLLWPFAGMPSVVQRCRSSQIKDAVVLSASRGVPAQDLPVLSGLGADRACKKRHVPEGFPRVRDTRGHGQF